MKRIFILVIVVCLSLGMLYSFGCTKRAGSAGEAIQNSQSLKTVQEKVNYLMGQANAFYNSKEFQQAIQTAQYVVNNIDNNSQQAKDLIAKAKAQLQAAAQKAGGGITNKLFGK